MRNVNRLGAVLVLATGVTPVYAQSPAATSGLGGYGTLATESGPGMGMGGAVVPYGGRFAGFMPYRMNSGGGTLSFQPRSSAGVGANRTAFSLSPMPGGMSLMPRGGGFLSTGGLQGPTRLDTGMAPMSNSRKTGVMPPSFGYPFRQPPSLPGMSGSSAGASM